MPEGERQRLRRRHPKRQGDLQTGRRGRHSLAGLRPERRVGTVVHDAQGLRRPARREPLLGERPCARGRDRARRLGRRDPGEPRRRAVPAHARLRARRHERVARRALRADREREVPRALTPLPSQGRARSALTRRGPARRAPCEHTDSEADRPGAPLRAHGRRERQTHRGVLLGPRRPPPLVRDRRQQRRRALRPARQAQPPAQPELVRGL